MAEEVKATQNPEGAGAETGEGSAKGGKKTKKINRMTLEELASKIEEIEKGNLTASKYYKHLMQRKRELESLQRP